jgi:hypothetical protein
MFRLTGSHHQAFEEQKTDNKATRFSNTTTRANWDTAQLYHYLDIDKSNINST